MSNLPNEELLSAYLDGEVTPEEQMLVEQAIENDDETRKLYEDLRTIRQQFEMYYREEPQVDFSAEILERTKRLGIAPEQVEEVTLREDREQTLFSDPSRSILATLVVTALVCMMFVFWTPNDRGEPTDVASVPGEEIEARQHAENDREKSPANEAKSKTRPFAAGQDLDLKKESELRQTADGGEKRGSDLAAVAARKLNEKKGEKVVEKAEEKAEMAGGFAMPPKPPVKANDRFKDSTGAAVKQMDKAGSVQMRRAQSQPRPETLKRGRSAEGQKAFRAMDVEEANSDSESNRPAVRRRAAKSKVAVPMPAPKAGVKSTPTENAAPKRAESKAAPNSPAAPRGPGGSVAPGGRAGEPKRVNKMRSNTSSSATRRFSARGGTGGLGGRGGARGAPRGGGGAAPKSPAAANAPGQAGGIAAGGGGFGGGGGGGGRLGGFSRAVQPVNPQGIPGSATKILATRPAQGEKPLLFPMKSLQPEEARKLLQTSKPFAYIEFARKAKSPKVEPVQVKVDVNVAELEAAEVYLVEATKQQLLPLFSKIPNDRKEAFAADVVQEAYLQKLEKQSGAANRFMFRQTERLAESAAALKLHAGRTDEGEMQRRLAVTNSADGKVAGKPGKGIEGVPAASELATFSIVDLSANAVRSSRALRTTRGGFPAPQSGQDASPQRNFGGNPPLKKSAKAAPPQLAEAVNKVQALNFQAPKSTAAGREILLIVVRPDTAVAPAASSVPAEPSAK